MNALDLLWPLLLALVNGWAGYRIGRHHLGEVERDAWEAGWDACLLANFDPDPTPDEVAGLLEDARRQTSPPDHPEMN